MPRDEKVIIKVSARVKQGMQAQAERYGMTVSALGSYILGKWLDDRDMANQAIADAIQRQEKRLENVKIDDLMSRDMLGDLFKIISDAEQGR